MNYRTEIAALKRLTKEIEQGEAALEAAKWERAKRVAELVDAGYTQAAIAADVGVNRTAVSTWVRIWAAYGRTRASARPRYADADYEIAGRGPGFGNSEPSIVAGATKLQHGNKVEIARKLLKDPEVAQDVMRDDRTRRLASKATETVAQELVTEASARDRRSYPQETADRDFLSVVSYINDANERVKAALRVLREGGSLRKDAKTAILDAIERMEVSIDWLRSVVESPHRSTDAALEALLRGEQ